jgi:endonuclease/exonuclease/phosphatase family metal-dependent hydrolase
VLEQFNRVLLAELDYRHVVHFEGNDARGVDVALLSRIPVGPVTSHRHLAFPDEHGTPRTLRRDLLRVRLQPKSGVEFDIFVVHLKSAAGSDPDSNVLRLAEARLMRSVLDELLRDDPHALFVVAGDFNSAIDSTMVQAVLGIGATALVSFADELAPDARITYNRPPYEGMIDFLFASPAMARRYVPRSFRILPGSAATGGSDHNPVAASFRVR